MKGIGNVPDRQTAFWLIAGLIGSFTVLRISLWVSPDADFNVLGYNIHHLFTGLLLVAFAAPPLIMRRVSGNILKITLLAFGAGLGMALDEWLYLIATDGSNANYLLPVSFWGGATLVVAVAAWILLLARHKH